MCHSFVWIIWMGGAFILIGPPSFKTREDFVGELIREHLCSTIHINLTRHRNWFKTYTASTMYFHKLAVSFCMSATVMVGFVPSMPGVQAQVSSIFIAPASCSFLMEVVWFDEHVQYLMFPPSIFLTSWFRTHDCIILLLTEHRPQCRCNPAVLYFLL